MKLKLINIEKTYRNGETVHALRDVSLGFREHEFVSILGPSGCGKTTLLNVIGGLDRYDQGDLVLGGLSTKAFADADWDAYRNQSIGFVFQNYNLITHQTVLQNVEISMTLAGVSASERKQRAMSSLASVGLEKLAHKKPNQLSGGQMQRVAIARALVNNPAILLADEPTGALDSQTSMQVMEILKEISKTRLVIMVTHNASLAEAYSSRIIRMLDGEIVEDSNPLFKDGSNRDPQQAEVKKPTRTAMSMRTAVSLSLQNLLTKKGRTIITAFAGSIGIIGVALVLALSYGLTSYMNALQADTLSGYPITISSTSSLASMASQRGGSGSGMAAMMGHTHDEPPYDEYPNGDVLYSHAEAQDEGEQHTNIFSDEYLAYIADLPTALPGATTAISYTRAVTTNVLAKGGDTVVAFDTSNPLGSLSSFASLFSGSGLGAYWQELPDNDALILSQYDLIGEGSRMPAAADEVLLVVDEYNRLDAAFFEKIGLSDAGQAYTLSEFIGKSFLKVIPNDLYYTQSSSGRFMAATSAQYDSLYEDDSGIRLTVVGILRPKSNALGAMLSTGVAYTPMLTEAIVADASASQIALAQAGTDNDVTTGMRFVSDTAHQQALKNLGVDTTPTGISIYPASFDSKDAIKEYLSAYNDNRPAGEQVLYSDMAEAITSATATMLSTVSTVLVGFAAISLIVSTIMIGIITYVSVIERTKEIGILRSVGARKKDISRVFNAETLLIGFVAGSLGVALAYLLTIPINAIILSLVGIGGIASLNPLHAVALILGSMLLTLIAGLFPAKIAANKDPVVALRTE
ncbi:ATP-binding cassette domain-containing protein [Eubacteriales bacterium OttesenSCG-928-A19]|nr:ATP-binding cassette domain-containing protein [Eubacteriales bacterium OttesenSCG-928-A19]